MRFRHKIGLLVFIFLFTACGPKNLSYLLSSSWGTKKIHKIGIVPFIAEKQSDQVVLEGASAITSFFIDGLQEKGYMVIPIDGDMKKKISSDGILPYGAIKQIGETKGIDAVLSGIVTTYKEREGGPFSVGQPASVGFEATLVNASDGNILWKGIYRETQKSFLEDISMFSLYVKRGWKWLRAEELAQYGVEEVLKTLPAGK